MDQIVLIPIVLWIISEAYRDAEDILEGDYIKDHTSRTANRATVGLIAACVSPWYGLLTLLLFWSLFDFMLNKFRGLQWNYRGSIAKTDKIPEYLWLGSKLLSLITTVVIILLYIK